MSQVSTLTLDELKDILDKRIKGDKFPTLQSIPQPESFKDITKATNRIVKAIKNNEVINIVGDYDADGVCSTTIMVNFFRSMDIDINYIIPNRFEHGYGISEKILDYISSGIIITVDNGISGYEAANICKQRGLDLIITDHHTVGDKLPEAYAIVNPKQSDCPFPFSDICGAQVAWYLCASIKKALNIDYNLMDLFDILSIAIVADIMPMVDLNRTMVKRGLKVLNSSKRAAIVAIKERFGLVNINEEDIGFKIAPLINCAGRMEDPKIALEFLLSETIGDAHQKLDYLIELNQQRKTDQLTIFNEAKKQVDTDDDVIVVASNNWNEGIVGIVASKLCDKYKKPALVFSIHNNKAKASGRSPSTTHLYNLLHSCSELLLGFGGHHQAAGLSLDSKNLDRFKTIINQNIKQLPQYEDNLQNNSLGILGLDMVNQYTYNLIEDYRPYGQNNSYPIFTFLDLSILNLTKMGPNKEFTKLVVTDGKKEVEVIIFVDVDEIDLSGLISFNATISKNSFRGVTTYNLMLKEIL